MSNKRCCVPGCVNNKAGVTETLHKFPNPAKDKELFNTWVYAIGGDILQLENIHIFKQRRVCHIHFEQKYWCRNNRLSNIALPTKNMPGLTMFKFKSEERVLRGIQTSEPSTSKDIVGPILNLQGTDEDIEVKENLDPKTLNKDADIQLHVQTIMGDAELKQDPELVNKPPHLDATPVQLSCSTKIKAAVTKKKTEIFLTPPHLDSTPEQFSAPRKVDVLIKKDIGTCRQNICKKTSHVIRKQHLKRITVTPDEHALYNKLKGVSVKLSKCRSKIRKQAIKIKSLQNLTTHPQFMKTLDNFPSTSKLLTLLQFREHKKSDKGRRFTMKEKIVALSMMKQSPKGYRFFRKIFILPSRQTLLNIMNMANINPGINKNIFEQIKKSTEKMKITHKLCVVLFDEMSLKPNVQYNERKDRVSGFTTNGTETYPEYADHAQVFMIRGLIKNYKQPVAYTFSQSATKGPELARQLKCVITQLQNAGLIVVGTVCDQGTNNVNCIKYLTQETRANILRMGEEPKENIIIINEQEILPLYDPPHLIKCIRRFKIRSK